MYITRGCSHVESSLGITSSSDGGVIVDARLHADAIRRSHLGGSVKPPAFALFRRSAINL